MVYTNIVYLYTPNIILKLYNHASSIVYSVPLKETDHCSNECRVKSINNYELS